MDASTRRLAPIMSASGCAPTGGPQLTDTGIARAPPDAATVIMAKMASFMRDRFLRSEVDPT